MEEIILPAMRSHVPNLPEINPKPTWHLPIYIHNKSGIDLDLGPLLLFDRAIIDSHSIDFIAESKRSDLQPLAESIKVLKDEGYVVVKNFGEDLSKTRQIITQHVENIVSDPLSFREQYIRGINKYREGIEANGQIFSKYDPETLKIGFGLHVYLMKHHGKVDHKEAEKLNQLLLSSKKRWKRSDLDILKELITPTITYLYQNMALSEIYKAPFIDADYTSELYRTVYGRSLSAFDPITKQITDRVREAQNLFNCVIPQLRPSSPKKMVKLLKHKTISEFRQFVTEAAVSGKSINTEDYNKLLFEVVRLQTRLGAAKGKIAWGERVLSLVPVPGLSYVVTGFGIGLEKYADHKMGRKYEWLYALIDAAEEEPREKTGWWK